MSKKNNFKKHKTRKYRKFYQPKKNKSAPLQSSDEIEKNISVPKSVDQKQDRPQTKPRSHTAEDDKQPQQIKKDLKKILMTFLGFVILILILYIIKIKTTFFDSSLNYLYKILSF